MTAHLDGLDFSHQWQLSLLKLKLCSHDESISCQCFHHNATSQLIYTENQLTGFCILGNICIIGNTDLEWLKVMMIMVNSLVKCLTAKVRYTLFTTRLFIDRCSHYRKPPSNCNQNLNLN